MKIFIDLRISGIGLNPQEITDELGIQPDVSYKKDDVIIDKKFGAKAVIYNEDCWVFGTETKNGETPEKCIEHFVLKFCPSTKYLKALARKFNVTFWISAYPENEQSNVHLSSKVISALSEMGVTVDCNVLFLKEFYDGTYIKED